MRVRIGYTVVLGLVLASGTSAAAPAATTPEILQAVEAQRGAKALAAEPIAKARDALRRAQDAQRAGDLRHGRLLAAAARQWALVAQDLIRAAQAEAAAAKAEHRLGDLETKLVRARALLEETIARRGRASEKLKEHEAPAAAAPAPAAPAAAAPAPAAPAPTAPQKTSPKPPTPPARPPAAERGAAETQ